MGTGQRELIEAIGLSPIAMVVSNPRLPDNPIDPNKWNQWRRYCV